MGFCFKLNSSFSTPWLLRKLFLVPLLLHGTLIFGVYNSALAYQWLYHNAPHFGYYLSTKKTITLLPYVLAAIHPSTITGVALLL